MLNEESAMRRIITAGICMTLFGCAAVDVPTATKPPAPAVFGSTRDGVRVDSYTLVNAHGAKAKLITLGATLVELHVPDRSGKLADVVLGFDTVAGYQSDDNQYFGCTTGRVANRIAKGEFVLDARKYSLAVNNPPNHLHGGKAKSLDKVVWTAEPLPRKPGAHAIRFLYNSPDGEENYPGNLEISVTYTLTDSNQLWIEYSAHADRRTPLNVTNHSYFNLAGEGSVTVLDHELTINADKYTPTDDTLIPLGTFAMVEGTPLNFRKPKRIGERIDVLTPTGAIGYDHNYVLDPACKDLKVAAARLKDPASGRVMTVYTDQPGVQLYSGNFLKGQTGKGGKAYKHRSAVCLETQHFPDSVNKPAFPSVIVRPGEFYKHVCVYAFSAE